MADTSVLVSRIRMEFPLCGVSWDECLWVIIKVNHFNVIEQTLQAGLQVDIFWATYPSRNEVANLYFEPLWDVFWTENPGGITINNLRISFMFLHYNPLLATINIKTICTQKPMRVMLFSFASSTARLDGAPTRCDDTNACHHWFLYKFKTCTSAQKQHAVIQWQHVGGHWCADQFIQCIMPSTSSSSAAGFPIHQRKHWHEFLLYLQRSAAIF